MTRCEQCGYQWPDVDEEGNVISAPYCHYEGPDEWAPCAQDEYDYGHEPYPDEEEYEYERWLDELAREEQEAQEAFYDCFEQPYDYKEF